MAYTVTWVLDIMELNGQVKLKVDTPGRIYEESDGQISRRSNIPAVVPIDKHVDEQIARLIDIHLYIHTQ